MNYEEQLKIEELNRKILESINGEELIEYYKTHNRSDTRAKFGLRTDKQLIKALTIYGYDFSFKKALNKGKPAARSHGSYITAGRKSAETQKKHWSEKTEEEKEAWSKLQVEAHSSEETKEKIKEANRQYQANLSDEERLKIRLKKSNKMKAYWNSLSPQEQQTIMDNRFKNGVCYNSKESKPNAYFKYKLEQAGLVEGVDFQREIAFGRKRFDFQIDKILIEINPAFTHNTTIGIHQPIDKHYHADKTKLAEKFGYRCIHVFDWDSIDKVITLILSDKTKLYARECEVRPVSKVDAANFINKYHLQNYAQASIHLGLFFNDELMSIMTFSKPRYNNKYQFELVRYCAKQKIVGGAEKLFTHFIRDYTPESIISYCDLSKFTGETYDKLGFIRLNSPQPSKHWYNEKTQKHITDNLLRQQGFDRLFGTAYGKGTSNEELMRQHGFVEIYDCGQATYGWHK